VAFTNKHIALGSPSITLSLVDQAMEGAFEGLTPAILLAYLLQNLVEGDEGGEVTVGR